jgi:hypothetical protein
MMARRS